MEHVQWPRRPRIPVELCERIDVVRGDVPFERWVRRALEQALGDTPRPSPVGREAKLEVAQESPDGRATAPLRASGPASARAFEPEQVEAMEGEYRELAVEQPPKDPTLLRCRVAGCSFKARSPSAICPSHGGKVRA